MRAQRASRSSCSRTVAFGGAEHRQLRQPVGHSSSSSSSNSKRGTRDAQQIVKFIQEWAPVLQAEHDKMQQAARKLAVIEQVLAVEPVRPTIPGPGPKLTAANTRARWLTSSTTRRITSSSFTSRNGADYVYMPLTDTAHEASSWSAAVSVAADAEVDLDSSAALQQALSGLRATEQEVSALLEGCMQEMSAVVGPKLLPTPSVSKIHSSNIVPWAPTAAAGPPAVGKQPELSPSSLLPPVEEAAETVSLPAPAAVEGPEVVDQSQDRLVLVYLNTAAEAAEAEQPAPLSVSRAVLPCVRYLRLPQQQQEYEAAVEQGLRVVHLKGLQLQATCGHDSSSRSSSSSSCFISGCLSVEELTWMAQENDSYGHEPALLQVTSADEFSEHAAPELEVPAVVKVEVGVHMRTKPGQRLLLVGNHPSLGSWDLSRAWKLKWSDGHVWRGCLELPANIAGIEFKAVLKSAEATVWERGSNKQVKLQGTDAVAMQYAFQA